MKSLPNQNKCAHLICCFFSMHVQIFITSKLQESGLRTSSSWSTIHKDSISEMESGEELADGRSLEVTPTWAVATVISILVTIGFMLHGSLKKFGNWLNKSDRKPLVAALDKVKDELIIFGVLSLLLGHWGVYVAKICVHSSDLSGHFYPCAPGRDVHHPSRHLFAQHHSDSLRIDTSNTSSSSNSTVAHHKHHLCAKGRKPLASYHSLEQLHRFLFVLGTTHVVYSFIAVALAVARLYSWRSWENQTMSKAAQGSHKRQEANERIKHLSSFVSRQTSHPWSHHTILVWLYCFGRQFWNTIDQDDYLSLRQGFITTHQLPLAYNFHNYMFRSMEEEFKHIVGISIPLWIFTILCVTLGFHGTNVYFLISFFPAILVLLIGTKLHHVIVRLAAEIIQTNPQHGLYQYTPKDDLFWFKNPRLLLHLIHFITFQNAFEMTTYLWSLWEIRDPSCFTKNHTFLVIRLTFGLVTQFWCNFITFPLYVIVAQMGSRYRKFIITETVRKSLHGWRSKASIETGQSKRSLVSLESLLHRNSIAFRSLSANSLADVYSRDEYITSSKWYRGFKVYDGLSDSFKDHSVEDSQSFSVSGFDGIAEVQNAPAGYRNQSIVGAKDTSSILPL